MIVTPFGESVVLHKRVDTGTTDVYGNKIHSDVDTVIQCIGFDPPDDSGAATLYVPSWSPDVEAVTVAGQRYACGRFPVAVNPWTGLRLGLAVALTLDSRKVATEQGER